MCIRGKKELKYEKKYAQRGKKYESWVKNFQQCEVNKLKFLKINDRDVIKSST